MLRARLAEARLAILLLTRIPVGYLRDPIPATGASAWAWPLAGLIAMLPASLVYWGLHAAGFGPTVAALGLICAATVLTGAMHEDGLADMADGFGGGQTRTRKLEIMRDSRIGSYGVMALILSVALHVSLIARLDNPALVVPAALGLSMASRAMLPFWLARMPAARADGLGHGAAQVPATCVYVAVALGLFGVLPLGFGVGAVIFAGVVVATALVAALALRQIGGQTGDVIGAMQKLAELSGWGVAVYLVG
ncbi:MAG: adenosylcobinamide-GDP ribazoletransferase [Sulfitobacter litoralis]|jgi:adenosylcobinamide-GDP ribazoletransferase|uniref:adenosylcobinamide-GDP ribazoletransferase n=1 Tax=Sulfitobacter TaxID=60136 RepID=UPI001B79AF8F|nr:MULTISPECIES: adenosylcobinamide-GDP ribazoletransferase [Sulfitobacter]MBQ0767405.1 adenosylcobinamide-GDP ribazoletransferase [Sulfitobacter litoralis]MCF7726551.1 adenosylcobinamide-GDP ribazoletransferase [Sulfitobacter sp. M22]MCF7777893.1 adenosylcobinamide-GDP ribazoletransferase [Sulfitobacter sp. M220]